MDISTPSAPIQITVTKSELRALIQCFNPKRFRQKIMTDQVIKDVLNLDRSSYNRIREFDLDQTRSLLKFFNIHDAKQ